MGTRDHVSLPSTLMGVLRHAVSLVGAWSQRRELARLTDLDDRMLADIGVTRQDLTLALAEPLAVDASVSLAAMARRSHRRAQLAAVAAEQRTSEAPRRVA